MPHVFYLKFILFSARIIQVLRNKLTFSLSELAVEVSSNPEKLSSAVSLVNEPIFCSNFLSKPYGIMENYLGIVLVTSIEAAINKISEATANNTTVIQ